MATNEPIDMPEATATKKVTIYSTPTCVFCGAVKKFFKAHSVAYEEYNVASDLARRQEMVEKSGQLGVPVIDIGGDIVVGYNERKIAELLGIGR